MEYSNDMQDVYKNIEDYNPNKKRKVLIVFDDLINDTTLPSVDRLRFRNNLLK